ncbi:MAG: L,D-transpeptidase family protein [Hyphomicrobiaceae bacterium]
MFHKLVCVFSLLCLVTIGSSRAFAVEPDAPEKLISKGEFLSIMVHRHLRRLPAPRNVLEQSERNGLELFYSLRNGNMLWVDEKRPTVRAMTVMSEISHADEWGLRAVDFNLPHLPAFGSRDRAWKVKALIAFELAISRAVLKYARQARGGRLPLSQVSTVIDRKPPMLSPMSVLTNVEASENPAAYLRGLHPQHRQFHLLREAYLAALSRERGGDSRVVRRARSERKRSRRRSKRRSARQTRLSQRLLYNMEMWRWMPESLGRTHVWANIPEYKFRVVGEGRVVHQERMIVGKATNMTPVFSDAMETVVFKPYWNIPNSIKVKELLPSLLGSGSALRRQNLRIAYGGRQIQPGEVDWSRKDIRNYHVYQPPGRGNALGRVKFLFPNKHAVYMHDTPTKHLFRSRRRAYSHGCMRVRNPLKLAEVLLSQDRGWGRNRIASLASSGPEDNKVRLRDAVPVHVTYFTAHVSASGQIKLFDDIYGHEKLIKSGLDGREFAVATTSSKQDLDTVREQIIAKRGGVRRRGEGVSGEYRSALGAIVPASSQPAPRAVRRRSRSSSWKRSVFLGSDS